MNILTTDLSQRETRPKIGSASGRQLGFAPSSESRLKHSVYQVLCTHRNEGCLAPCEGVGRVSEGGFRGVGISSETLPEQAAQCEPDRKERAPQSLKGPSPWAYIQPGR